MLEAGAVLQERYEVLKPIGQGGMGAVYLASDQRLGSTVALKETFFNDPLLLSAFKREARLLAGLKHAAMPKVIDHFADGDGQFLVMEFIAGDDLEALLKKRDGPFSVDEVLEWTDQLLDALDYLHSQNPPVIHRDIKPQNLKLTSRSQIVLLDFGLAKGTAAGMTITNPTASLFGYTPSYAPLEQIQGSGTDAKSDLYSLAATVYHMLTATKPVDALTRASAFVNGGSDPLAPANEVNLLIPDSVSGVLMQALALKRDERPSSAAEMRRMLRCAIPPTTETLRSKPLQRESRPLNTAAARFDPSTEALTFTPTTPNKAMADRVTNTPGTLASQNRAQTAAYRRASASRAPMAAHQWQSATSGLYDQSDSSRGKLIALAVVFIVAIAVIVYALNRGSNTDAAIETNINSDAQVKDSNQSDTNAKTPAASPADSNTGVWPSAIREQPSGEERTSSTGEGDTAREEEGVAQETAQPETKRAEASPEPEKTESRSARTQEGAEREDRPPPPEHRPPPPHAGPPPEHRPPPPGMPPPRRRP